MRGEAARLTELCGEGNKLLLIGQWQHRHLDGRHHRRQREEGPLVVVLSHSAQQNNNMISVYLHFIVLQQTNEGVDYTEQGTGFRVKLISLYLQTHDSQPLVV